jgi:hypothetical protein
MSSINYVLVYLLTQTSYFTWTNTLCLEIFKIFTISEKNSLIIQYNLDKEHSGF